jgi:hypothetical protein
LQSLTLNIACVRRAIRFSDFSQMKWNLVQATEKKAILIMMWSVLQLYKTRDGKYLLDIQRVDGPNILFLDLCNTFLAEVGAV